MNWKENTVPNYENDPFYMWAKASDNPELHRKYGIIKKEKKEYPNLKKNEILLGGLEKDYSAPAKYEWDGKSERCIIFGAPGSGKTQLLTWLIEQKHVRYGMDVVIVSPKMNDYKYINSPQDKPELIAHQKKYGFTPQGMNSITVTPKFLGYNERLGTKFTEYIPSINDFSSVDDATMISTFAEFFWVMPRTAEYRAMQRVLINNKKLAESTKEFEEQIKKDIQQQMEGKVIEFSDQKRISGRSYFSTSFLLKFQEFVKANIIGDEQNFNFPEQLRKNGFLIYQITQFSQSLQKQSVLSTIVKLMFLSLFADRMKVMATDGKDGILKRPIVVGVDEAQILAPRRYETPARAVCRSLVIEQRLNGFHSYFATQNPLALDEIIQNESELLFMPRVENDKLIKLLRDKDIPEYVIQEAKSLRKKKGEIPEWLMYNPFIEEKVIRFTPFIPLSKISEEQKMEEAEELESGEGSEVPYGNAF